MLDSATSHQHSAFCAQARATHETLREALSSLRDAGQRGEAYQRWQRFEDELLHHLRNEDELLLPAFDLDCYADAARVRSQHHEMRELSLKIGTALAAGRLDEQSLSALEKLLADNAQFEERSLFPWAQRRLQPHRRGEFHARARTRKLLQHVDGGAKRHVPR